MNLNLSRKQIIGLLVLVFLALAVPVGIYLVSKQQVFKGKALEIVTSAFEIKDSSGNIISCDSSTTPPTCITQTPDITIQIKGLTPLR